MEDEKWYYAKERFGNKNFYDTLSLENSLNVLNSIKKLAKNFVDNLITYDRCMEILELFYYINDLEFLTFSDYVLNFENQVKFFEDQKKEKEDKKYFALKPFKIDNEQTIIMQLVENFNCVLEVDYSRELNKKDLLSENQIKNYDKIAKTDFWENAIEFKEEK